MKILMVGRFGQHDNADEDAIAHGFRQLGHEVTCVEEAHASSWLNSDTVPHDWGLFFKWPNAAEVIQAIRVERNLRMPFCYWHFDLIESADPTLAVRSRSRVEWVRKVLPMVRLGIHTDGDWVQRASYRSNGIGHHAGKLRHLMQGADERFVGPGKPTVTIGEGQVLGSTNRPPILFMGMVNHGQARERHVAHLKDVWGPKFEVLGNGGAHRRVHGRALADLIAGRIVVAPDGPQTNNYWSNRIYLVLGFGGFLVHPHCEGLDEYYPCGGFLAYRSWSECDEQIEWALKHLDGRDAVISLGYRQTLEANLYRHRCQRIVEMMSSGGTEG